MGRLGLGQGHGSVHDWLETTAADQVEDGKEVTFWAHGRAQDLELAEEDVTQVGARVPAAGGAAGDDASVARGGEDELLPDLGADVLEDDVDPALAGEPLDLGDEILRRVVDGLVGAERARA